MDRSNIDVFTDVCRASEFYDSDNPTWFHTSELTATTMLSYLQEGFKNMVKIADTAIKSQNILVYSEEFSGTELAMIDRWIQTIGRRGL